MSQNDTKWTRRNGRLERRDITKRTKQQVIKQSTNRQKLSITKKKQPANRQKLSITKKKQPANRQKLSITKKKQPVNRQKLNITKKRQAVKQTSSTKIELIQPIFSYLTIIDRIAVSKTSKFYNNALKASDYWQDIVIDFNEYDKRFGYPLNMWALLMQKKASFKALVITIGSGESEIVQSLVSNCKVNQIEKFKMYVTEDLFYLTCYHHSTIDLLTDENPVPISVESKLKTFYDLYDCMKNEGSVIPKLAQSYYLRDVRLVIYQTGDAEMIRTLTNLVSLTVSVVANARRDEVLIDLIKVLLDSIEMLPQLTLLSLKDNFNFLRMNGRVQIMSKKLSVKSKTLKILRVDFGKFTRLYDIQCPLLEIVDINTCRHYGNIYLYEEFRDILLRHEALSKEQQDYTSYSLINDMRGKIVIENPGSYNNCKYVGVCHDRRNRICYFNYIHLPKIDTKAFIQN